MAEKIPYRIECRKNLEDKTFSFLIDDKYWLERGQVPEGLEEVLDFQKFVRVFSEGAANITLKIAESYRYYGLDGDFIEGDYRHFVYKKL